MLGFQIPGTVDKQGTALSSPVLTAGLLLAVSAVLAGLALRRDFLPLGLAAITLIGLEGILIVGGLGVGSGAFLSPLFQNVALMMTLGVVAATWLATLAARALGNSYRAQNVSDQMVAADAQWLIFSYSLFLQLLVSDHPFAAVPLTWQPSSLPRHPVVRLPTPCPRRMGPRGGPATTLARLRGQRPQRAAHARHRPELAAHRQHPADRRPRPGAGQLGAPRVHRLRLGPPRRAFIADGVDLRDRMDQAQGVPTRTDDSASTSSSATTTRGGPRSRRWPAPATPFSWTCAGSRGTAAAASTNWANSWSSCRCAISPCSWTGPPTMPCWRHPARLLADDRERHRTSATRADGADPQHLRRRSQVHQRRPGRHVRRDRAERPGRRPRGESTRRTRLRSRRPVRSQPRTRRWDGPRMALGSVTTQVPGSATAGPSWVCTTTEASVRPGSHGSHSQVAASTQRSVGRVKAASATPRLTPASSVTHQSPAWTRSRSPASVVHSRGPVRRSAVTVPRRRNWEVPEASNRSAAPSSWRKLTPST